MAFKFDQLSDRMREKLLLVGPDVEPYWNGLINLLRTDPQGQIICQIMASINRARDHHIRTVHPLGSPRVDLIGYSGRSGLENIRAEFRIVGAGIHAYKDINPEKPADVGSEVVGYMGRYYGLFGPGVKFDEGAD